MVWRKPAASRGYGGCRSARACRQLSQRSVATKWIAATPPSWRRGANWRIALCDRVCTGCCQDPSGIRRQYRGEKSSGAGRGSCAGTASAAGPSVFILLGRAAKGAASRLRGPLRPFALFQANHPGQQRLRRLTSGSERRRPTSFCPSSRRIARITSSATMLDVPSQMEPGRASRGRRGSLHSSIWPPPPRTSIPSPVTCRASRHAWNLISGAMIQARRWPCGSPALARHSASPVRKSTVNPDNPTIR